MRTTCAYSSHEAIIIRRSLYNIVIFTLRSLVCLQTEKKVGHIKSFFELNALDIDKNVVNFEIFRDKVTVVTNVASYCGEKHLFW